MLGLAIDSADRTASAALWKRDDEEHGGNPFTLLAIDALSPEVGKADQLITVIERLLAEQTLDYRDLDVIAVNRGPGSFTGIRSAVALGRALALATGLPVLGVSSHEALAASLERDPDARPLMIALDARRGEVYAQAFSPDGRPLGEIEAKPPAAVADDLDGRWRLAGSGARLVAATLSKGADARPDHADVRLQPMETEAANAGGVALAAAARLAGGEMPVQGFELRPLYVRAPDAVPPAPLIPAAAISQVPV